MCILQSLCCACHLPVSCVVLFFVVLLGLFFNTWHLTMCVLLFQPRVETKPEAQSQPPRVREQRPRERPGFPPRGPRPGNVGQLLCLFGASHERHLLWGSGLQLCCIWLIINCPFPLSSTRNGGKRFPVQVGDELMQRLGINSGPLCW